MLIVPICEKNASIFEFLAQDYESEFSFITKKEPDVGGRPVADFICITRESQRDLQFVR